MRVTSGTGGITLRDPLGTMNLLTLVLPLVNVAVAMPLALRKVPPNRWYGFRTKRTLSDTQFWYEVNSRGGMNLVIASAIALAARFFLMQTMDPAIASFVSMAVLVGAMLFACYLSMTQLKSL